MPLSWIYSKVMDLRNRLYDRESLDAVDLGAPTISVGNLTTGGTGKTPLVAYIARILVARGEKVCILTRGYGRADPNSRVLVSDGDGIVADPASAGDEPYELALRLLGKAVIIADKDRTSAAGWARDRFGVTRFVLDDGFQHRRIRRDVDIVCVDAQAPWGGGKTLPGGRLREPAANLYRAGIVVITRADLLESTDDLRVEIAELAPQAKVFEARNTVSAVKEMSSGQNVSDLPHPSFAFCGIGNPQNFFGLLQRENIAVAGKRTFRDHHSYRLTDINELEREAASAHAASLLTTGKDAVKLQTLSFSLPCFVVQIETVIDNAAEFEALI